MEQLKNKFLLFSGGTTVALLGTAKALKPAGQKNLLTLG
jgi:hypothetical protein